VCEKKRDRDIERKRKRDTIVARRGEMGGGRQLVYPLISIFLMVIKCNKTQK
jgi:hypothetical protein